MILHSNEAGRARWTAVLPPLVLLAALCGTAPAEAQGGPAISGSFSRQLFEIPPGASLSSPDVYMVVFNNRGEDFRARMKVVAPLGVNVTFSEDDFLLDAGGQKKILIGVEVTNDAALGEHEIKVTVERYREEASGIQILGAAGQSARLVVVSEGRRVAAQVINPSAEAVAEAAPAEPAAIDWLLFGGLVVLAIVVLAVLGYTLLQVRERWGVQRLG